MVSRASRTSGQRQGSSFRTSLAVVSVHDLLREAGFTPVLLLKDFSTVPAESELARDFTVGHDEPSRVL